MKFVHFDTSQYTFNIILGKGKRVISENKTKFSYCSIHGILY